MKWVELADRVMVSFDNSNENRYKVLKYLSEGENDFAVYTKCLEKEIATTPSLSDWSSGVPLPDDFMELSTSPTFGGSLLTKYNNEQPKVYSDGTKQSGTPRYYYIAKDLIHLVPFPSNAQVFQYLYIATPNNHDNAIKTYGKDSYGGNATTSPSIPQAYHIYICDYAKAMMLEEQGEYELSDRILRRYYSHRDVIRAEHTNRDYGNEFALVSDLSYVDIDI